MPDGTKEERPDHPVSLLFTIEPNKYTSAFTFVETLIGNAALYGNAYAVIEYSTRNASPRSLRLVRPENMDILEGPNGSRMYRESGNVAKTHNYDSVLHISNTSWDGIGGLEVLRIHRETLGLAIANRNYGANFYKNGAQLSGVLKHPGALSKEAMQRLKSSWRQAYEGSQNAGRTAILEEGMDYVPITLKPGDAAFVETKRLVVADIARIFGVPQYLLEDMERATFNNIEHLSQQFLTLTIRPWCKRLEAEINRKLFTRNEKGRFYAFLDFDDLLVADLTSRANYARTLFNVGALSPNDIRKMSGYNPIEGGDNHYVQVNMADINAMPVPNQAGAIDNVQTLLNETEEDE
jgi:HK97 family phage portal protein